MDQEYLRTTIVGLAGSGKTTYLKSKIRKESLIFDPLREFKKGHIFRPTNRVDPNPEYEKILYQEIIKPYEKEGKQPYLDLVIDEGNRPYPNKIPLPQMMAYINDFNRHLKLNVFIVARRLSQLNTDLVELSHKLIIYRQTGINDIKRANDIIDGAGEEIKKLKKYHYLEIYEGEFNIRDPIKLR
jgi:GTPase SAR1 family protein